MFHDHVEVWLYLINPHPHGSSYQVLDFKLEEFETLINELGPCNFNSGFAAWGSVWLHKERLEFFDTGEVFVEPADSALKTHAGSLKETVNYAALTDYRAQTDARKPAIMTASYCE